MAKIFLGLIMSLLAISAFADPGESVESGNGESHSNDFWPPDMVPHPILPEPPKQSDLA